MSISEAKALNDAALAARRVFYAKRNEAEAAYRQLHEERFAANEARYYPALQRVTAQMSVVAATTIEQLGQLAHPFPEGKIRFVVVAYSRDESTLAEDDRLDHYTQVLQECVVWQLIYNVDHPVYFASDGKIYIDAASRHYDERGRRHAGLHQLDSTDIAPLHDYEHFPYGAQRHSDCDHTIENMKRNAAELIKHMMQFPDRKRSFDM